jgi:hypothetical protein
MLHTDAEVALREGCASGPDEGHLFLRRACPTLDDSDATRRAGGRPINNGVGWIEILQGRAMTTRNSNQSAVAPARGKNELAPARGVVLGIAFGVSIWALIGGMIGILFF